jgi:hypothetical protein
MTSDQLWRQLRRTLCAEQATGTPEGTLRTGQPDTAENCAERRRVLEAETLRYERQLRTGDVAG